MNIKPTLMSVLVKAYPSSSMMMSGEDYESLTWMDQNTPKPTKEEAEQLLAVDMEIWEAAEYTRLRKEEYPTIQEQLDMQYWDSVNGTTVWADTISAIKSKYPK